MREPPEVAGLCLHTICSKVTALDATTDSCIVAIFLCDV